MKKHAKNMEIMENRVFENWKIKRRKLFKLKKDMNIVIYVRRWRLYQKVKI